MPPVQRVSDSPGRVTIAEVAAQAGVGASTVSRVLNGGQVSVRARTRSIADGCVKKGITSARVPVEPVTSDRALACGR